MSDVAGGSYGVVRRARLDGYPLPVAVKELRQAQSGKEQFRVELVRGLNLYSEVVR